MTIRRILGESIAKVRDAGRYVAVAYGINFVLAASLAAALASSLRDDLGHTIAADNLRQGWDGGWYRGFSARAEGLASTFDPGVTGIGAPLTALDDLSRGALFDLHPSIVVAGVAYLLAWSFLSGGFIARFVQDAPRRTFFADAAHLFPRMAALAALAGLGYLATFRLVFSGLSTVVASLTYETTDERVHFAWTLGKYAITWGIVWTIGLVFDYARVAVALEPGRGLRRAVAYGSTLVRKHAVRVYGVSVGVFVIAAAWLLLYALVAPGPGQSTWLGIAAAFALSQTFILGKVALRALGWASVATLARRLS